MFPVTFYLLNAVAYLFPSPILIDIFYVGVWVQKCGLHVLSGAWEDRGRVVEFWVSWDRLLVHASTVSGCGSPAYSPQEHFHLQALSPALSFVWNALSFDSAWSPLSPSASFCQLYLRWRWQASPPGLAHILSKFPALIQSHCFPPFGKCSLLPLCWEFPFYFENNCVCVSVFY